MYDSVNSTTSDGLDDNVDDTPSRDDDDAMIFRSDLYSRSGIRLKIFCYSTDIHSTFFVCNRETGPTRRTVLETS